MATLSLSTPGLRQPSHISKLKKNQMQSYMWSIQQGIKHNDTEKKKFHITYVGPGPLVGSGVRIRRVGYAGTSAGVNVGSFWNIEMELLEEMRKRSDNWFTLRSSGRKARS
jgi:hypothetical protein